jgi:signal transduction histidine kinase
MKTEKSLASLRVLLPDESPSELPPQSDSRHVGETGHFVQFYEDDPFLISSVGAFIAGGLRDRKPAVIFATPAHRQALDSFLRQSGLDSIEAQARGKYFAFDAAETLSQFMINGSPDEERFVKVVGGVLARTANGDGLPVRAFGEMVALLWEAGNADAALKLEGLWNNLARKYSFSLFCAYPMHSFRGEGNAEMLTHICRAHEHVIPSESYTDRATADEKLVAIALLQQKAARLEAEIEHRKEIEQVLASREGDLRELLLERERTAEILEQTVAERTSRLRETVAELEAFSYSLSHDMRSPLRAMQGYAKTLLEEYGHKMDPLALTCLQRIERASQRLDLLIRDVLAYSKVAKGQIQLKPTSLEPIIDDIMCQHPELAAVKDSITVTRPLPVVMGHDAYLTQCLSNLIANALKFVGPGQIPSVEIRADTLGDKVKISIADNGIGIHPEHHNRIFQIFGRVYPEKLYPGTGIGLAIVKKAVTRMGGEIGFESDLGKGSTFWFVLPRAFYSPGGEGSA